MTLTLVTIRNDTRNMLNMQHITPNLKRWDHSDIPGGGHKNIKGPIHMAEGGHHLRKAPTPHPQIMYMKLFWNERWFSGLLSDPELTWCANVTGRKINHSQLAMVFLYSLWFGTSFDRPGRWWFGGAGAVCYPSIGCGTVANIGNLQVWKQERIKVKQLQLTHWGLVSHISISEQNHQSSGNCHCWLVICPLSSHHLNQCWLVVNEVLCHWPVGNCKGKTQCINQ